MAAKRRRGSVAVRRAPQPERRRRRLAAFWSDKERRRALLLSLLLHAGVLLGVVWLYLAPEWQPPEELIVLELTPPEVGASEREAAAVDDPAPQAPDTQVAGNAAEMVETEIVAAPEAPTEMPAETLEEPADAPQEAQAPTDTLTETPAPPSERPPQAQPPSRAALPSPDLPTDLPTEAPASTLPEIEAVEVAPQPLEDAIALPAPNPEAAVTPSRRVAVTPQVALSESRALPTPAARASVAIREVALPPVQAEVAPADAIPQPAVQAVVARAVPQPQAGAVVAPAQAVPRPAVSAEVASRAVPEPQVGAVVSAAQEIPQPAASGAVTPAQNIPQPQAGAVVAEAQPLAVTPGVALSGAVPVVTPEAAATVTLPEPPASPAVAETGTAGGEADAGDGARSAQADLTATAAQGAASDGDGVADTGVANVQSFEVTVERPLAVLLDNADAAYPQQGLVEAWGVFEMPVEGGLTRLMSVYTRSDPAQVGPIRSARDYFLEAALAMNGTLVHVGGAPSTVSRIASQDLATVDALQEGTLFAQAPDRLAPHSTFSTGTVLRDAVGSLENRVSGTLYAPPGDAPDASSVSVAYSADYTSGFRYLRDLDQYRWVRSGSDATDAASTAVTADVVVVARVTAFPYPDDPAGRLYLPYSGGEATLYLRGKAVPGSWTPEGGFTFQTESGAEVDLTPFKHWILFAPETAQVSAD